MRRQATTLIEVLAVLAILVVASGAGLSFGRDWLAERNERQFFRAVLAQWQRGLESSEIQQRKLSLQVRDNALVFTLGSAQITIEKPTSLSVFYSKSSGYVREPGFRNNGAATLVFVDHKNRHKTLTINLGWGMMTLD